MSSKISNLFAGFPKCIKLLKVFISKIFIYAFGLILLIFPVVIFDLSYSMSSFVIAENNKISAIDALKQSKRLMKENKKRLFKLSFKNFGWALLCLTGIGAFWALPYLMSVQTIFYSDLKTEF